MPDFSSSEVDSGGGLQGQVLFMYSKRCVCVVYIAIMPSGVVAQLTVLQDPTVRGLVEMYDAIVAAAVAVACHVIWIPCMLSCLSN